MKFLARLSLNRPPTKINITKLTSLVGASSVAILFLFVTSVATAEPTTQTRDPYEYFFNQSFNHLQEEAETAREEGKMGLFVMFNDPDCPWCQKMKATIMNQVPVQEFYRKHFRIIHLDTRGDTMMSNFDGTELVEKDYALKNHRVRATPVLMFFDLDGNIMMRYTGATRSVEEFLLLGEFVTSGAYKSTKFTRFKRERMAKLNKK
ncbi:MAG: thioredoxin fold domain-containing protein [Gammaproteobacteria bacterium]|nr:thioredoxin fold domain-containing protein [Gammaproteobacteria bacterium]